MTDDEFLAYELWKAKWKGWPHKWENLSHTEQEEWLRVARRAKELKELL